MVRREYLGSAAISRCSRAKKNEWLKEKATLELKADTKTREVEIQQESLDRKNSEVRRCYYWFHCHVGLGCQQM